LTMAVNSACQNTPVQHCYQRSVEKVGVGLINRALQQLQPFHSCACSQATGRTLLQAASTQAHVAHDLPQPPFLCMPYASVTHLPALPPCACRPAVRPQVVGFYGTGKVST
jgi:hypothetical protein